MIYRPDLRGSELIMLCFYESGHGCSILTHGITLFLAMVYEDKSPSITNPAMLTDNAVAISLLFI